MSGEKLDKATIQRGTLGVVILTRAGIVLAADSRSAKPDGTFEDAADKIFKLSDKAACTIAGVVASEDELFGIVMKFNFPKAIEEYQPQRGGGGAAQPVIGMARSLGVALTRDLWRGLALKTASPFRDGGSIGTFVIAGYSELRTEAGQAETVMEAYKYKLEVATQIGQGPLVLIRPSEPTLTRMYFASDIARAAFGLLTNGNSQIVLGILEEDPEFQSSRKHPAIARFFALRDKDALDSMNLEEATALAEGLITESIRIAGNALGVGGQIDIAQITLDKGFRWVPGHEPERKRKTEQPAAPQR